MGTQAYPYKEARKFPLLVLNTLLGAGMSSRLFQNIREKYGIAYSIYSFVDFLYDTGIFGIYVGTDSANTEVSIDLINKELQVLRQEPVSVEALERTKLQLKGNLMLGLESTASRMNRLAKMEIYLDDYYTLDQTIAEIEKVQVDDVLNVASELFDDKVLHTTVLRPGAAKP
jgi:predicted Zn-dependent peptidase